MPLLAAGRVKSIVERVVPLVEITEAHRCMESNAYFRKIIIDSAGAGDKG